MTNDFDAIEALRLQGLSFSEIGDRLGITKDAARNRWARGKARRDQVDGRERPHIGLPLIPPAFSLPASSDAVPARADGRSAGVSAPAYVNFDIGFYDLEASGLTGSFGRLFSGACQHAAEGDVWVARIDDPQYRNRRYPSDDKKLAVAIRDHLESHDIIVSWNGKRNYMGKGRSGYDIPMLNTRLVNPEGGSQRMMTRFKKHIDLLPEARKYLQLHSFRLAAVEEFLELAEHKNSILPRLWNKALDGDKASLDYIVEHNLLDVRVLRLVFEEFRRAGLLERPSW